jgi:outer membrane protein OmpA-like peptidoglycan-associated protein
MNAARQSAPVARASASAPARKPQSVAPSPGRERCGVSNQATLGRLSGIGAQAKLRLGDPGDSFEREADRTADHVMRMTDAASAPPPNVQRKCAQCSPAAEPQEVQRKCSACEDEVQRKTRTKGGDEPDSRVESEVAMLRHGGEPLSTGAREFFEPRFGVDFSGVRIHASGSAARTARSIDALAFTTRNHIVFAEGQYQPSSNAGRYLLAHELAHTIQQGAAGDAPAIQKRGNPALAPTDLGCTRATDDPPSRDEFVVFSHAVTSLDGTSKAKLHRFIAAWHASGGGVQIRIDGYASPSGGDTTNWRLSCERARKIETELVAPSKPGLQPVDPRFITVRAQGETREFAPVGATGEALEAPNRRATLSLLAPAPAPTPPVPPTPVPAPCAGIPTATPPTCLGRNAAYCAAAACKPTNAWLPCVCRASAEICRAVDGFDFVGSEGALLELCVTGSGGNKPETRAKAAWFRSTNACIWGHWRAAFDAIHNAATPIPGGLTPEWASAVTICRASGIGSRACCRAHVIAEQQAIDRCGPYPTARFGALPTDVPGTPRCSSIVAALAPPPPFSGDFGLVADRITYGISRCCS